MTEAHDRLMARTFTQATDHRSRKLEEDLANQFALGNNKCPMDPVNASDVIVNCQNEVNDPDHPTNEKKEKKEEQSVSSTPHGSQVAFV